MELKEKGSGQQENTSSSLRMIPWGWKNQFLNHYYRHTLNLHRFRIVTQPAYCRRSAYNLFQEQLSSIAETQCLFRAAFAIALHERPEASLAEAETTLEHLVETVRGRVRSNSVPALLAHLHDVLFEVFGLRGNSEDYYNPANSYLPDVFRTRLGIPITLVLVYKCVAEPLGLAVNGINAPGHFLAEVVGGEGNGTESLYVDPFFGGGVLKEDEVALRIVQSTGLEVPKPLVLPQATPRQWLARMLNNLQAIFVSLGQERDVCAMQELHALL